MGFVKVEQAEESTVVHIHGKGLHLAEDKRLKVYIFYVREGQCIGLWQGDIGHVDPAVNFRLAFTPDDTGRASNYPLIEGIILENAGQRRFAAVWDDMPVDVERMQVFKDEPEPDLASLAARRTVEEQEAYGGGAGGVPGDEGEPSQEVSGEDGQDDLPEEEPGKSLAGYPMKHLMEHPMRRNARGRRTGSGLRVRGSREEIPHCSASRSSAGISLSSSAVNGGWPTTAFSSTATTAITISCSSRRGRSVGWEFPVSTIPVRRRRRRHLASPDLSGLTGKLWSWRKKRQTARRTSDTGAGL